MPTLEVTTKSAEQVWKSPDGQRVIYKVALDYNGQTLSAKTYSQAIATEGWSGTIESYEKEGRNGAETFVKQPPKENPGYGSTSGGSSRSNYAPRDDSHIKAQWAIGQAATLVTAAETGTNIDLEAIEALAKDLFAMVDRVKTSEQVTDDVPDEVHDPTQVSIEELNTVLDGEVLPKNTEMPWPKS